MKNVLLSLVILFNSVLYSQSLEIKHKKDYNPSRLPLGYNTGHLCSSGSGIWTELQPKVPRVDYWRVFFVNRDTGLAVGDMGAIIKTTDGGGRWYTIENNFNVSIKALGNYSGNPIFAAGGHGLIIKSTDYGENWEVIPSGTTKNFWNIEFIDAQTAWLVGDSAALYETTDGGDNWVAKSSPLIMHTYYDISFYDNMFGYIGAAGGYVLRTRDGGNSWDTTYVYDIYGLFTIKAVTRQKAVALGYAGKQINTADGGENWHLTTYLGDIITDMDFIDTLKGFAVGISWGFETKDGGLSWKTRSDMIDGIGITFPDNETGYMLGMDLVNQKTTNGGESWKRMIINDDFTDLFFTDENNGWIIGNQKLYQTTDGGNTLIQREDFPGDRPSSVYFLDSLTGIVGAMNKIFKTTNGGITWLETNISGVSGNAQEYFELFFANKNIGWAVGFAGYIIKTTDSGENWQYQMSTNGLRGIYFIDTLTGWVARDAYSFQKPFKTIDGGVNWIEQVNLPLSNTRNVFFNDSLNGFITQNDKLYHTSDGGLNFNLVPEVTAGIGNFSNKISDHIFLTGGNRIYFSVDVGDNWEEIAELQNKGLETTKLITINKGISVGDKGIIYKYLDTTYTPVEFNLFRGSIGNKNNVLLEWSTATEINNKGFEIERSQSAYANAQTKWERIGFVVGNGTTPLAHSYSYTDKNVASGKYSYRLKQVDFDGSFEYSKEVEVEVTAPLKFALEQNYPNPFNPVTIINYQLPIDNYVTLKVYNEIGQEVARLVNEKKTAGRYEVEFDGSKLASGVYIYRLTAGSYTEARKLVILK